MPHEEGEVTWPTQETKLKTELEQFLQQIWDHVGQWSMRPRPYRHAAIPGRAFPGPEDPLRRFSPETGLKQQPETSI